MEGRALVEGERGGPRLSTGWRLLLVLTAVAALGWGAAVTFIAAELEADALEAVGARADAVDRQVRGLVRGGADPRGPEIERVLVAAGGWLVDPSGEVIAGSGQPPTLPETVDPRDASERSQVLSAIGPDGAVVVSPLADDGRTTSLLVVGEPGEPVGDRIARLRLLLAAATLGVVVVVAAIGASLLRQMRLRLDQRTSALTTLLRRERETVEKLGEVDAMKTAFLTAISHELRTPLTVVAGFTELLAARGDQMSREQIKQLAAGLEDKTARLTQLIDDLLDVDRLARGVLEPDRKRVDAGALIEHTIATMAVADHEVVVDDRTTGPVEVDPGHLQRVVENLVRNAMKYGPSGSRIDVVASTDGAVLDVVVADRGPGIADVRKEAVFEPLQRVDADDPNPGLGVGLALVAHLAELHGGRAWVTDRDGGGAQVHARFGRAVPGD